MTMHKILHSRDDIDRLYVSRKEKGREHINIEDYIQELVEYTKKSKERLITAASNCKVNIRRNRKTTKTRKEK